jgi:hypothetical protein
MRFLYSREKVTGERLIRKGERLRMLKGRNPKYKLRVEIIGSL